MTRKDAGSVDAAERRRKAEAIARARAARSPENIEALSPEEIGQTLHELRVHQIELEMQNEELRRAHELLQQRVAERADELRHGALQRQAETTEREQAAFKLSEVLADAQRLREVLDRVSAYIYIKDRQSRYVYANRPTLELFGCSAEALVGCDDTRFFPPDTVARLREVDARAFMGVQTTEEIDVTHADGRRCVYWEVKTPLFGDPEGKTIRGLLGVSTDITARKQAEVALRQSEELLRGILDTMPDAYLRNDADGRLSMVSPSAAAMFGYTSPHDLLGLPTAVLYADTAEWETVLRQLRDNGRVSDYVLRGRRKDGSSFWVSLSAQLARDGQGNEMGIEGFIRDISERQEAAEALRVNERLLSESQRLGHVGSWLSDMTGTDQWSDETFRIYGVSPATFSPCADSMVSLVHPDDRAAMRAWVDACAAEQHPGEIAFRIIRPDGTVRSLMGRGDVVRSAAGRPPLMAGTVQDITERKQSEDALRASEEQLGQAMEQSLLAHWEMDAASGVFTFNDRFYALYATTAEREGGYQMPADVYAREFLLPEDQSIVADSVATLLAGDVHELQLEHRIRRRDGELRHIVVRVTAVRDAGGRVVRTRGANQDITERKRSEQQFELVKRSIDTSPDGAYWFDRDGRLQYVNDAGCRMLGYTRDELLQMRVGDISIHASPDRWAEAWAAVKQHGAITVESEHRRKDGSVFPVEIHSTYVTLDEEEYCNGFAVDITLRKQAELDRIRLRDQLAQAQKMESIGQLAGGVAHDFNNMLGVILGHAEFAIAQVDPTLPLHADLVEIRAAASRSADLTRQLLAFARRQAVTPTVLDLNETVGTMLTMLQRLIGENINLVWRPGRTPWRIKVDPSQIDQMLANLCVNARDAIAGVGTITIDTETIILDDAYCASHLGAVPGEYVRLAVSDDGCGIEQETLSHLFEPFFTTKGVGKGTGLGLSTVYGIVKQNNGFIDVVSEPGTGTTFTVYLPRHVVEAEQARTKKTAGRVNRGHETILLVEDNPAVLKMTTRMLAAQGYTVLAALSPAEAIRVAEEHAAELHLVMTDVVMPGMNGRDLAAKLLSLYPHLKRLFTSGYTADVISRHGVLDDGVSFLQKPYSADDLAAKVRAVLEEG